VLVLLLLAGCSDGGGGDGGDAGGDGTSGPGGATGGTGGTMTATGTGTGMPAAPREATLAVAAVGAYPVNPAFDPPTASVPAGALVQVTFSNNDLLPFQHNWVVEGIADASSATIAQNEQDTFAFTAPDAPGTFAFYCSIGDHRDRGMEGTLTVTA
jgi:plastocyanin